jgi:hypothetical protein
MNKHLPPHITIRITSKGGVESRVRVAQEQFKAAWEVALCAKGRGSKVEALVGVVYV